MGETRGSHSAQTWATAVGLGLLVWAAPAQAEQIGPFASRTLTLGAGTVRIDGGPPDFGYFHPGSPHWLNENRGFRMRVDTEGQELAWLGVGVAVGATDELELGGLLLPFRLTPDSDVDDMELYGRYAFLHGDFEMGVQITGQLPTLTEPGLGFGLPMLAHATYHMRIDTGVELEVLFWEPDAVTNVDIPLAFTWDVGGDGFIGPRTGLYIWDFDDVAIPAGLHGGGVLANGHVDLSAWFMWPFFIDTGREDEELELSLFELGFGINGRVD
jgi:hypothetical protein